MQVYFCLSVIIGDNLGNNGILGLIEGFRGNYYCRICKLHRSEAEHQCCPVPINRLRTEDNYNIDVALNNSSETGVKELCVCGIECLVTIA